MYVSWKTYNLQSIDSNYGHDGARKDGERLTQISSHRTMNIHDKTPIKIINLQVCHCMDECR